MNDIICPNCQKGFKVDKAGFADILKQVRDHQFEEELNDRLNLAEKDKENAIKLAEANITNKFQEVITKKDVELTQKLAQKEKDITELNSQINNSKSEMKLAVSNATIKIEKERDGLINELQNKDIEKKLLKNSLNEQHSNELKVKDYFVHIHLSY